MGRWSFAFITGVIAVAFILAVGATEHRHNRGIHITKESQNADVARNVATADNGKTASSKKADVTMEWLKVSDK